MTVKGQCSCTEPISYVVQLSTHHEQVNAPRKRGKATIGVHNVRGSAGGSRHYTQHNLSVP